MSMGDEVGYGAGIAPHPNGEREKTSAIKPELQTPGERVASAFLHHATPISIPSNPTSNPDIKPHMVADMGQNHPWRADNLIPAQARYLNHSDYAAHPSRGGWLQSITITCG